MFRGVHCHKCRFQEAQKAIKDLQTLMKDLEQSRENDRKDLLNKLDRERKEWEKEKNELKHQIGKVSKNERMLTGRLCMCNYM